MPLARRHLDVALFGLLLLLGAVVVRGWMREGGEALPSAAAGAVAPLRGLEAAAGPRVDLLPRIDPVRDRVGGDWTVGADGLRSPVEKWARLQLPCLPPQEYDLGLTATRLDKDDALIVGFVLDGRQGQIVLDGNAGRASWMEVKDGTHGISPNGITFFQGPVFANGRPAEILVAVRKERVEVRVDGFQVLVWRGPPARLFVAENWGVPHARALFLGAWQSVFSLSRIDLSPIRGDVDFLR